MNMQTNQGGLLGGMQAPQQPQGGLLGAMSAAAPQGAQGGADPRQMAQQLAQNPTPQMAQQIVAQMRQAGMPEADQMAQIFSQAGDDPQAIKQIADAVLQSFSQQ
ncbi:hypothetical protein BN2497_2527 [Janthinobacterium sp. CG23_2]|nr:hypothetical protein BN2497_2527 [Janthinobacterium sp. CG23_2]CUU27661.1 hypothetical protein BN3177_2527 [Janthinobacterium sp. CG23_2]